MWVVLAAIANQRWARIRSNQPACLRQDCVKSWARTMGESYDAGFVTGMTTAMLGIALGFTWRRGRF